jgi:flagellar hook-length control protein FliK
MDATRLVEIKVNPAAVSPHSPALSQPRSSSNPVSAATATLTGSSVAGEGPAGVVASGLTQQPAAIVDSRAQWRGTNAAVAQPVSPGLPAQGLPGDLEQAVRSDITTASAPVRVALATDPASSAESEQLVLNPATARAALTGEVARQLDKNINSNSNAAARIAPPGEIAVGMVAAAKDNLTLADITGVRDASAIAEPRNGEIHLAANSILSQQLAASLNSGSSPQGPVTAPAAALTPAQASQPNPLPAQLEGLSLSRNADATEWGKGLGDRVNWMIDQKQNRATIRLDPPFLGKLEVQIRIADDATTVTIQTQHPQTRDLIEAASSRLRDMLQDNGYQNVNVDVSQRQDQQQAQAQTASADDLGEAEDTAREDTSRRDQQDRISSLNGDGIVDTFA